MKTKIKDYYNNRKFYPFMPPEIFDALEKAFKAGSEYAEVDKELFDEMINKYREEHERK